MKRQQLHISRYIAILLCFVFSLTIAPWSVLHEHESTAVHCAEQQCSHKIHIKKHADACVICTIHFEKNYLATQWSSLLFEISEDTVYAVQTSGANYQQIVATALRGPPAQA